MKLLATSGKRTPPFPISTAPWSKSLQIFNVRKEDEERFVKLMEGALQRQERLRVACRKALKQPPPLVLPTEDEHDEISYERAVSSSSPSSSLNMLQPPQTALESVSEFALEKLGALTFRNRERGGAIGGMRAHTCMERARSFGSTLRQDAGNELHAEGEGFSRRR